MNRYSLCRTERTLATALSKEARLTQQFNLEQQTRYNVVMYVPVQKPYVCSSRVQRTLKTLGGRHIHLPPHNHCVTQWVAFWGVAPPPPLPLPMEAIMSWSMSMWFVLVNSEFLKKKKKIHFFYTCLCADSG